MKLLPSFKSAKAIALAAVTIATAAISNITSTLAEITPTTEINSIPTTQPGKIFLSNNAPNTKVSLSVTFTNKIRGRSQTIKKDNIVAPGKVLLSIPSMTTHVVAIGEYSTGSEKPIVLFHQNINPSANECFKISRNGSSPSSPVTLDMSRNCPEIPPRPIAPPPPPPVNPPGPLNLPIVYPFPPAAVISAPGKPDVVIFDKTKHSLPIGCGAVRNLWSGLSTTEVSLEEYEKALKFKDTKLGFKTYRVGDLHCNSPAAVKGYTSPLFGKYAGVIMTDGKPFFIDNREFFTAMGVTPTQLNDQQARDFVSYHFNPLGFMLLTTKK
jgi:hypothetical protein